MSRWRSWEWACARRPLTPRRCPGRTRYYCYEGQGGTPDFAYQRITIEAASDPTGENPTGQVLYLWFGVQLAVSPVTCLDVNGNTATINFRDQSFNPNEVLTTIQVVDDQPDTFDVSASGRDPGDFTPAPPGQFGGPLIAGHITVHDALTRPQARAACLAEREQLGKPAFRVKYGRPGRAPRNCIDNKRA